MATNTDNEELEVVSEQILSDSPLSKAALNASAQVGMSGIIGVVLTYVAHKYATDADIRGILIYAVPTLAVFLSLVIDLFAKFLKSELKYKLAERDRKRRLSRADNDMVKAEELLAKIESDPNSTAPYKRELRSDVQRLQRNALKLRMKGSVSFD